MYLHTNHFFKNKTFDDYNISKANQLDIAYGINEKFF